MSLVTHAGVVLAVTKAETLSVIYMTFAVVWPTVLLVGFVAAVERLTRLLAREFCGWLFLAGAGTRGDGLSAATTIGFQLSISRERPDDAGTLET